MVQRSADWVQYVLDLPMKEEPGQRFEYCNDASHLLSAIITEATGRSALDYAREHLFDPLGIHDVEWEASPQGITFGWARIQMKPHDAARWPGRDFAQAYHGHGARWLRLSMVGGRVRVLYGLGPCWPVHHCHTQQGYGRRLCQRS